MEDVECRLVGHSVVDGVNIFVVELIDHSVRSLSPRNAVHVGIYAHPTNLEPILDEAETVVTSDDFSEIGGQRKAYVTVRVSGVNEPLRAYLSTHIFTTIEGEDFFDSYVENRSMRSNAHYITLLPHNDPTVVEQILRDGVKGKSSFVVKADDGGLRVSGLKKGTHLRIYGVNGVQLYSNKNADREVFVPLKSHAVYLVSDGKDVQKFAF
jgi:hypothetical protein